MYFKNYPSALVIYGLRLITALGHGMVDSLADWSASGLALAKRALFCFCAAPQVLFKIKCELYL